MMFYSTCFVVVLVAAAAIVGGADAVVVNCTGRYQAVLQQAHKIRDECGTIEFKDCCQVRSDIHVYRITRKLN